MKPGIMVINSGSTSLKFALYQVVNSNAVIVCSGAFTDMPHNTKLQISSSDGRVINQELIFTEANVTYELALKRLLGVLKDTFPQISIEYAGHRIVQGGEKYSGPIRLDSDSLDYLEGLTKIEPTHQYFEVMCARVLAKIFPNIEQVAVFDTSFHRSMPKVAEFYSVSKSITDKGIRHWGFHGISYEYISKQISTLTPFANRVIVAHLGGGASLCAIKDGKSIDTSMQFGPLTGIPMATRSGDFPADAILYLLKNGFYTVEQLEDELAKHSGLLGASEGISDDMRILNQSYDPRAIQALDMFEYSIIKYIGSYLAILEGVDAIVFTAGIGENDANFRARIIKRLAWLGAILDETENKLACGEKTARKISASNSKISIYVIPTNEELMIAQSIMSLFNLIA